MEIDDELPGNIVVSNNGMGNDGIGNNSRMPKANPAQNQKIVFQNKDEQSIPSLGPNGSLQPKQNLLNTSPQNFFKENPAPPLSSLKKEDQNNFGMPGGNRNSGLPEIQGKPINQTQVKSPQILNQSVQGSLESRGMGSILKPDGNSNPLMNNPQKPNDFKNSQNTSFSKQNPNIVPHSNQPPLNMNISENNPLKSSQVNFGPNNGKNMEGVGPQVINQKANQNNPLLGSNLAAPEIGKSNFPVPVPQGVNIKPPASQNIPGSNNIFSQGKQAAPIKSNGPAFPNTVPPSQVKQSDPFNQTGLKINASNPQPDPSNLNTPKAMINNPPSQPVQPDPQLISSNPPGQVIQPPPIIDQKIHDSNLKRGQSPSPEKKLNLPPNLVKKQASNKMRDSQIIPLNIPKDILQINLKKFLPEEILNKLENISNIFTDVLDYNLIIARKEEFQQKLSLFAQKGSKDSKRTLEKVMNSLVCKKCQNMRDKSIELKCGHLICIDCFNGKIQESQNFTVECPECGKSPEPAVQSKILDELQYDKDSLIKNSLKLKYEENRSLECGKCKVTKKNYYDNCPHMCKECFANVIRNNKTWPCSICYDEDFYNEIINEVFTCESCGTKNYFIGSYGKYVCNESYLFCINCCYNYYNSGSNEKFEISLKKYERVELNEHIFRYCGSCKQEKYRGNFEKLENCDHFKCSECMSQPFCKECLPNN